jgi:1-acyl-sn-glycerol-3-phosphate acyltransferase
VSPPFTPARKNRLGEWILTRLVVQPSLRRAFGGVYAYVDRETLALRGRVPFPVIFCATHSGWWDGHLAYILNWRIFRHDAYLMMEEKQLRRYLFFTWAGVFGIDREDPHKALASVRYITRILLERPNTVLWMFPQGKMAHPDVRPLGLYGGAANIARRVGRCALVPVALRYDFLMEQAPDAFVRIGAPLQVEQDSLSAELTEQLRVALTETADRLHNDVASYDLQGYRRILSGRGSINAFWDRILRAAHLADG